MTRTATSTLLAVIAAVSLCCRTFGQSPTGPDAPTDLLEKTEEKIVVGSAEDFALAGTYQAFRDKGPVIAGQRITIMTKNNRYKVGEPIRVFHVREVLEPGIKTYLCLKEIYDEYIDGKLVTKHKTGGVAFDGGVQEGSGVDLDYDITSYTFDKAGSHTIQWKGGGSPFQRIPGLESNVIKLEVVKE